MIPVITPKKTRGVQGHEKCKRIYRAAAVRSSRLSQAAPENTLGAFQGAVDGGYEGIEIDVQMTRDGEIVIAHDSNFTRMTLGLQTADQIAGSEI